MLARSVATLALITTVTGCLETSYTGRDPRKAYVTMSGGQRGYTRGGEFHSDVFGGGLEEVVQGNREAEEAASTFHDRMVGGFLATIAGAICMPTALAYQLTRSQSSSPDGPTPTFAYVALGCGVLMMGGAIAMTSAIPYQLDAINIYNDGVDATAQWQVPRFPQPPPQQPMQPMPPAGPPGGN